MVAVTGIGSGLDINGLVTSLVAAEGDAKTLLLSNKRSDTQFEISAFGGLKSILTNSFAPSLTFLKTPLNFQSNTLTPSDPDVFTVTSATGSIAPGAFDIEVRDFAEAHKVITSGFTDQDTVVGTGSLTISVGSDSFTVTIDSENDTLAQIRSAINDASDNTGVSATIVNVDDGSGGTEAKLILSSNNTGTDNAIKVIVDDDDSVDTNAAGLSAFYFDTSDGTTPEQLTEINAAIDAEVYVDGQKVLSSSNTVVDAIQGVTITLLKKDPGTTHQMTVASDIPTIKSNIEAFVANYNTLRTFLSDVTEFDPATGDASVLLGDATTRGFSNQIRSQISNTVTGISGSFTSLVNLGITSNKDGTLKIDQNKLSSALSTNMDDVAELFSSTNGVATKLDNVVNEYTKINGLLDKKVEGLTKTVTGLDDDLQDLQRSLETLEIRLLKQFSGLDILLSDLNTTSNFLAQQFEAIANITNFRKR